MASRLGLGRIIGWAKEADQEELHFVLHRLTQIAQERAKRLEGADGLGKVKRGRRAQKPALPEGQHPADSAARGEAIGA